MREGGGGEGNYRIAFRSVETGPRIFKEALSQHFCLLFELKKKVFANYVSHLLPFAHKKTVYYKQSPTCKALVSVSRKKLKLLNSCVELDAVAKKINCKISWVRRCGYTRSCLLPSIPVQYFCKID